ncbi:MAG: hypothetical protein QW468_05870 [Candidatus Bathyarchaeia archaeon]
MSSPYANYWNTFNFWMSLDNPSWKDIPFMESITDDLTQMAYPGRISLSDPQLTIYQKYYVPPQTLLLPLNVTKEDVSNIRANVLVKLQATPADRTQWILAFITMFGLVASIAAILDHSFLEKEFNKTKKSRTHTLERKNRILKTIRRYLD